jgi:hypothetical protein
LAIKTGKEVNMKMYALITYDLHNATAEQRVEFESYLKNKGFKKIKDLTTVLYVIFKEADDGFIGIETAELVEEKISRNKSIIRSEIKKAAENAGIEKVNFVTMVSKYPAVQGRL